MAFTVLGIEHVRGAGKLLGLAVVEVDVGGVVLTLQGVQIVQQPRGGLACRAPMFRAGDGAWRSAVVLPDTLRDALGAEVLAAFESLGAAAGVHPFGAETRAMAKFQKKCPNSGHPGVCDISS